MYIDTNPEVIQLATTCISLLPDDVSNENVYGQLLHEDEHGITPVICGCGGSMWLCRKCKEGILKKEAATETREEVKIVCNPKERADTGPCIGGAFFPPRSSQF